MNAESKTSRAPARTANIIVWTAVITPMNPDGSVDYPSLRKILEQQAAAGNGITILGSTGEALNLDNDECRTVLEFGVGLGLNTPMMCGVGGHNLNTQLRWVEYLNTLPLDAYLMVVPIYAKPGMHGQYEWFKALLDKATRPCMLYNVPGRSAKPLDVEATRRLADHPGFWALKEASGNTKNFSEFVAAAPAVQMMSGDDGMLPDFTPLGCQGVVSVAGNVWPEATQEYARQCLSGEFKDVTLWKEATDALFTASNPIPAKGILARRGVISSGVVRAPLSEKDLGDMSSLVDADVRIQAWLENARSLMAVKG